MGEPFGVLPSQLVSSKWTQFSILGLITLYLLKKVRERSASKKIQAVLAARIEVAQKEREESIEWAREQTKFVSDDERNRIEGMDFRQLREALQSGEVSAESVVRVYYGLAVRSHEKTNCLTNIIKESLNQARELNEKAKDASYKKPRLFGMPISIKEAIELEGHRNSWGLAKLIDRIPKEDSYQVMKLTIDGMIPFCQTNVHTACMGYTCSNAIYVHYSSIRALCHRWTAERVQNEETITMRTTTNPYSSTRTCGGSSGGEAALIASGGSLIGQGTDLAGSSRIPAAFSGCCGFKPSATRCSMLQFPDNVPWRPIVMMTEGPLAQDPHAIAEVMRSQWSDNFISGQDPFSVPVGFREDLFKEGTVYRIGYFTSDGCVDPLPGNQRVVKEAVELLKTKGHELVHFSLDDIANETARGLFAFICADGGAAVTKQLKDEPLSPRMAMFRTLLGMPLWSKKLIGWMVSLRGDSSADFFLCQSDKASDIQAAIDRVYACRKRLVQKMKEERIDLLLCPSFVAPAMPHDLPLELPFTAMMATLLWNTMDFPAGVVTTSSWTEEDEKALESYPEKGLVEAGIKKGCRNSVGLPLSVQIVAPCFRDEMVLRVMADLFDAVKN